MFDTLLKLFTENKNALEHYAEVHKWYKRKTITNEQWSDFCSLCLDELLTEQSKVFEKLSENA